MCNEEKGAVLPEQMQFESALQLYQSEAESLISQPDKLEIQLQKTEEKLREIKGIGDILGDVIVLISMIRAYIKGEYTEIPVSSIIGAIAALLYYLAPADILPDIVPGVGYLDDAFVIGLLLKMISVDIELYREWREEQEKERGK